MKNIKVIIHNFILIFGVSITASLLSQQSWYSQNSGTAQNINSIIMLDVNTGYVSCTGGVLIKTTNSGLNWFTITGPFTTDLLGVKFFDSNTGLVFASPYIYRTTNSGSNWNQVAYLEWNRAFSIADNTTLYAGGGRMPSGNDTLMSTTNRGYSWTSIRGLPDWVMALHFINPLTGFETSIKSGVPWGDLCSVYKTTNSGGGWFLLRQLIPPANTGRMGDIFFTGNDTGYYVSTIQSIEIISSTYDGGIYWHDFTAAFRQYTIFFVNAKTGWSAGNGGIVYKTTDAGNNWFYNSTPVTTKLKDIQFVNNETGWVVGDGGVILKTTNGGFTHLQQINSSIPRVFSILQNYPNPFNPTTKILFQIPLLRGVDAEGRRGVLTKLTVYDILGKEIATLINEQLSPGTYEVDWDGTNYPSGVYYYTLTSGDFKETRKMVLIK